MNYSKNRITDETLALLYEWARDVRLEDARDRMFAGEKVNITEGRAVLHTALRGNLQTPLSVGDGYHGIGCKIFVQNVGLCCGCS